MENTFDTSVNGEKKEEKKLIKVLALCDSPTSATGFAQVSRNVLRGLARTGKYKIDVLGINYYGDYYDRETHPYSIYPAMPQGGADMYGRDRLISAINGNLDRIGLIPPWDIVFTIQDPFIIEGLGINFPFGEQMRVALEMWKRTLPPPFWFKWIAYFPVDSELKENWVDRSIALPSYPVAYCEWGRGEILKFEKKEFHINFNLKATKEGESAKARIPISSLTNRISVIHHGVDLEAFKPISKEEIKKFKKEYFRDLIKDDTFLIINISRNQPRKDLARTLKVFSEFKKRVPNSHLYLHCKSNDAGGSTAEMGRNFGLAEGKDFTTPIDFSAGIGYPVETVNKLYNAADLCITTTLGEGWGFITTEAMAAKTPVIAPNITSILDIFNSYDFDYSLGELGNPASKLRGIPVKAGSTLSEWICLGIQDNERIRPLTNVEDMVEKMIWVRNNPEATRKIVERAYKWVQDLTWSSIVEEWDRLFIKAFTELEKEREVGKRLDKAGRNEPCPCGSGAKFKKCHGSEDRLDKFKDWRVSGNTT